MTDVLTPVLSKNWGDEKSWTRAAYEKIGGYVKSGGTVTSGATVPTVGTAGA